MMLRSKMAACFSAAAMVALLTATAGALAQRVGPAKGTLVIDGGLEVSDAVGRRFAEFAGGAQAKIALIPTAAGDDAARNPATLETFRKLFGAGCCAIVHAADRAAADRPDFAAQLKDVTGVWMMAGAPPVLSDTYWHTATERALAGVLDRGGVVGGGSSGGVIMGVRIPTPRANNAFGFLKNTVIWAHADRGQVQGMLLMQIMANPQWIGLGIAERTAAIVKGDALEVIGEGDVTLVDGKKHGDQSYLTLHPGDRATLKPR